MANSTQKGTVSSRINQLAHRQATALAYNLRDAWHRQISEMRARKATHAELEAFVDQLEAQVRQEGGDDPTPEIGFFSLVENTDKESRDDRKAGTCAVHARF